MEQTLSSSIDGTESDKEDFIDIIEKLRFDLSTGDIPCVD